MIDQPQDAPYNQSIEEAVIGAVLVDPNAFLNLAAFLTPEDFFFLRHQYIWEGLLTLNDAGEVIDYLTLANQLDSSGRLVEVGGAAYLTHLINSTPTAIHAEAYGRLVERDALRRRLLQAADEIKVLARDRELTVEEVTSTAEAKLFEITERRVQRDIVSVREATSDYLNQIEEMMQHRTGGMGLFTGFNGLDRLLGGLQRSDLIVFAGRPGMGKTSFLLSLTLNAAMLYRGRVAIFSLEMGAEQIVQRMVAMETGINMQRLRTGQFDEHEYGKLLEAAGRLSNLPIYIDDSPSLTPLQLRTKTRRIAHEHGLDLIIVDYMQLMNAGGTYQNNRVQEISYISRMLKELARELNVPLLSAAQLSRAVEQRQDKRPQLSDLRESGSIEQDSDIVMFLYRDIVYNEATENPNSADVIVAKHRNGPTDVIQLYFDRSVTKFLDATRERVDLTSF